MSMKAFTTNERGAIRNRARGMDIVEAYSTAQPFTKRWRRETVERKAKDFFAREDVQRAVDAEKAEKPGDDANWEIVPSQSQPGVMKPPERVIPVTDEGDLTTLSDLEERFAQIYASTLSIMEAAAAVTTERVEHSKRRNQTLQAKGMLWLQKPHVFRRIQELKTNQFRRLSIDSDDLLITAWRIANVDPRRMFDETGCLLPVENWPDEVAKAIGSFEVQTMVVGRGKKARTVAVNKVKFDSRMDALKVLLGHASFAPLNDDDDRTIEMAMDAEEATRIYRQKLGQL